MKEASRSSTGDPTPVRLEPAVLQSAFNALREVLPAPAPQAPKQFYALDDLQTALRALQGPLARTKQRGGLINVWTLECARVLPVPSPHWSRDRRVPGRAAAPRSVHSAQRRAGRPPKTLGRRFRAPDGRGSVCEAARPSAEVARTVTQRRRLSKMRCDPGWLRQPGLARDRSRRRSR